MPAVEVVFYCEANNLSPVLEFLKDCERTDKNVVPKLQYKIQRLADCGWELRRPEADFLRNDIYELRVRHGKVNYRLLYSFFTDPGDKAKQGVLLHGCTKEAEVPAGDIDLAIKRMDNFTRDPAKHTYQAPAPPEEAAPPEQ